MLLGVVVLFTAALFSSTLYRISLMGDFSSQFSTYANIQTVETFEGMIQNTQPAANSTAYSSWLNSLHVCGRIDGVNVSVSGSVMVISTRSRPTVYAIVQIN